MRRSWPWFVSGSDWLAAIPSVSPSGDRLVREYAECMVDDNSGLHRRMASREAGTVPLSVAVAEARVRAQLQRGELTMTEMEESYARFCG